MAKPSSFSSPTLSMNSKKHLPPTLTAYHHFDEGRLHLLDHPPPRYRNVWIGLELQGGSRNSDPNGYQLDIPLVEQTIDVSL
jgi:hypothetical protein